MSATAAIILDGLAVLAGVALVGAVVLLGGLVHAAGLIGRRYRALPSPLEDEHLDQWGIG